MSDAPAPRTEAKPRFVPSGATADLLRALWGEALPDLPHASRWFVLHTKPRQEKALAESLAAMHIPHYLPTLRKLKYYGHRRRTVDAPMFSGYLFAIGDKESGFRANETKRVANIIDVADQERLAVELRQIQVASTSGLRVDSYRYLTSGRSCRVVAGPLRGVEGVIESRPRADRLILQVQALGQAVAVEVDPSLIELLDGPAGTAVRKSSRSKSM